MNKTIIEKPNTISHLPYREQIHMTRVYIWAIRPYVLHCKGKDPMQE